MRNTPLIIKPRQFQARRTRSEAGKLEWSSERSYEDESTPEEPAYHRTWSEEVSCCEYQDLLGMEDRLNSVVFSFWTSTLDLIETALKHDSLGYVSIEGQVPEKKRATALKIFEQIPQSKSCCSLHLAVLLSRRLWELF